MYVLVTLRYRVPIETVVQHTEAHRAYLRQLKDQGKLLASGPFDPRSGGALLLRLPDGTPWEELAKLRDGDPFVQLGVAQYDMQVWNVVMGKDALDGIK
jgi:uncharacterized protein YciI